MDAKASTIDAVTRMLRRSDCFRGLSSSLCREVAALSELRVYDAKQEVFAVNDPGDYLYGVLAGSLLIYITSADGREVSLSTTEPGEIGGEIAVLDGGSRTTNGRALQRTTLALIPREELQSLLLRQPQIALHMMKYLCQRVRQTSAQVEDVVFLSLSQRLAKQLHVLVAASGSPLPVKVQISQSELAGFLNATRQAVNTILQTWQRSGLIKLGRGRIEVFDLDGLLAQGDHLN